ncbi:MAG: rod shape-determining protein RodA [Bdellovibrionales bacterium GWA2_49_15]|nr:MAG: rod shape-determining protein RodA [Bdellovibrionales bacterium GWA2_49_15]HAZ11877.1 rod shape-determining protein RodA [Bdellovibrionales bacterium]
MNFTGFVSSLRRYDFSFFGISAVIFLIGVINLYSATHTTPHAEVSSLFRAQIGWYFVSLVIGISVSFIQPKNFYRLAYFLYLGSILFLILTLVMGQIGMGARRWLAFGALRFQPSELMKLFVVLGLARFFAKENPDRELGLKELIIPALLTLVPVILIMAQPDLGTALLLLLVSFSVCFYRKLKLKTLLILAILGLLISGGMYKFGLRDYQKKRITTFIDPETDVKGSGYNAVQSKIAIGSGQFFGKGFNKSSQASFNYLPENHTDFAFSVFNEEHGFFGALILISFYVILFYRFLWLASNVTRIFESVVAIGLMSILFWHTFINMGMVMGILPIVGVPLPYVSYGGTSLLTFGIACGIVTSISNARNLF